MTTPIKPTTTTEPTGRPVIDLVPMIDGSGTVTWTDVRLAGGHVRPISQPGTGPDGPEAAPRSQLPTARMAAGPSEGDATQRDDAPQPEVLVSFDPDRLAWCIQPHPRPTAGPAGTHRLALTGEVELVVDAAEPHRFLSVTVELPTSSDDPDDLAVHPAALQLVSELFGAQVAEAVSRTPPPAPDADEGRAATWSILPLSPTGAANRANVCTLAAIRGLAAVEPYPTPWWAADMVIPATACTPGCGLSEVADSCAGVAAREFADLSEADTADLDPDIRHRLDALAPVLEHLVPGAAADIRVVRRRLGQPPPHRIRLTDDEVNDRARDLERFLNVNFGRELAAMLVAAPSGYGLTLRNAIMVRAAEDNAALGETVAFTAPPALAANLPEQVHVRLCPIAGRPHAVQARFPLRPSVTKLPRAWIRLGLADENGRVELVTESKCWVVPGDGGSREGVAELVLPDGLSPHHIAAVRVELADGPTWPRARDAEQLRSRAEGQVRRGQCDEAMGDAPRAARWYGDAARRYHRLEDSRREAAVLQMAARAWSRSGNQDAARRAADSADRLHPDITPPPPRAAYLGEWFGQQTDSADAER